MSKQLTVQEMEIFERLPEHIKRRIESLMVERPDMSMTDMLSVASEAIEESRQGAVNAENLETVSTGDTCNMPKTILGRPARKPSVGTTQILQAIGHPLGTGELVTSLTLLESAAAIFIFVHPSILDLVQLAKSKEAFYDAVHEFAFALDVEDIAYEIKELMKSMPEEDGGDTDDTINPTGP